MNYVLRLKNIRAALKKQNIDALVITDLTNVRWACGYTGTSGLLIVLPNEAHFVTDFRYQEQAAQQVEGGYAIQIADKGLWQEAAKVLKKAGAKRVALKPSTLPSQCWKTYRNCSSPPKPSPRAASWKICACARTPMSWPLSSAPSM